LEISKTRGIILLLLGEKAGMREDLIHFAIEVVKAKA
jgi:hypothetical protein